MTARLTRAARSSWGRPAAPVAAVHLGLGAFFRAHQAAYTHQAGDAEEWGYAAFTGRSPDLARTLAAQDGLYTLLVRGAGEPTASVLTSISETHAGTDTETWLTLVARPTTRLVTLTVTEAAYRRTADGAADLEALRRGEYAQCRTIPGRLVAGLAARRHADGGPLAVVPCDNLLHNGDVVRRVVTGLAAEVDPGLLAWIEESVSFVNTEVDRITPRTTAADVEAAERLIGAYDAAPIVTEPFSEWVLAGAFPAGRPAWEQAGALFVDDVTPFEQRKLWLLNGAHSLLAYAGSIRGHRTVADAIADPTCRGWVEEWWDEACGHLPMVADDLAAYRDALLTRFANPGIEHLLAQVAADGSQKLPVRILPVLSAERAAGNGAPARPRSSGHRPGGHRPDPARCRSAGRRRTARARRTRLPPARRPGRRRRRHHPHRGAQP